MTDKDFQKKVLSQLDAMDQRLGRIEADIGTIKSILKVDEQVANLLTINQRRREHSSTLGN